MVAPLIYGSTITTTLPRPSNLPNVPLIPSAKKLQLESNNRNRIGEMLMNLPNKKSVP